MRTPGNWGVRVDRRGSPLEAPPVDRARRPTRRPFPPDAGVSEGVGGAAREGDDAAARRGPGAMGSLGADGGRALPRLRPTRAGRDGSG